MLLMSTEGKEVNSRKQILIGFFKRLAQRLATRRRLGGACRTCGLWSGHLTCEGAAPLVWCGAYHLAARLICLGSVRQHMGGPGAARAGLRAVEVERGHPRRATAPTREVSFREYTPSRQFGE